MNLHEIRAMDKLGTRNNWLDFRIYNDDFMFATVNILSDNIDIVHFLENTFACRPDSRQMTPKH